MKIFISYTRKNKKKVNEIVSYLKKLGHTVWLDKEIQGGTRWWKNILREIKEADVFVFILSSEASDSTACATEIEYAHKLQRPILPIMVSNDVKLEYLPKYISDLQVVDFVRPKKKDKLVLIARPLQDIRLNDLPSQLPDLPEQPVSPLSQLRDKAINGELDPERIIIELKVFQKNDIYRLDVVDLAEELRSSDIKAPYKFFKGLDKIIKKGGGWSFMPSTSVWLSWTFSIIFMILIGYFMYMAGSFFPSIQANPQNNAALAKDDLPAMEKVIEDMEPISDSKQVREIECALGLSKDIGICQK